MTERYDYLILGSGNGGGFLAWHMAGSGRRVAVVERRWVGGSCPNINCMPTKNEIWSAKVSHLLRHGEEFGALSSSLITNMTAVRKRKRDMVAGMVALARQAYGDSGAELIMGSGRFVAPKTLEVSLNDGGSRLLTGERVFLNVGTRATIPDVPGLRDAAPLTNIEALELDYVPRHLIVLGAGYVGLELAQAFRRFGSQVTVIEHGQQIAGREDPDVSEELQRILGREGIDFILGTDVLRVEGRSGKSVRLLLRTSSGERTFDGTDILSAVGRTPNTDGIGLDIAGVKLDDRGYIKVSDRLETTAPDVWGIGECCSGNAQFTHVSFDDFRILRDNFAGGNRSRRDRLVPYCLFTDPPLARIGLSELEAKRQGIRVRVAKLPVSAILRARTIGEQDGFLKALVAEDGDQILGFTMVGPEAGEVMPVVQTAMLARLPFTVLRDAVLAHPTMAEGLGSLLSHVPDTPTAV